MSDPESIADRARALHVQIGGASFHALLLQKTPCSPCGAIAEALTAATSRGRAAGLREAADLASKCDPFGNFIYNTCPTCGVPTSSNEGFEIDGAYEELVLVQTASLLRAVGHGVDRCDCGTLFLRVGKRRSCSIRCQKRVYMRRFRASTRIPKR